jgi:hypothetical protein
MDSLKKFLTMCSGANQEILDRPECAIEYNKYIGIELLFSLRLSLHSSQLAMHCTWLFGLQPFPFYSLYYGVL